MGDKKVSKICGHTSKWYYQTSACTLELPRDHALPHRVMITHVDGTTSVYKEWDE